MIRFVEVPEITKTHQGKRLVLEGGWKCPVPLVKMDRGEWYTMLKALQDKYECGYEEAREMVNETVFDVWWRGWFYYLKWFLINWMCFYYDRFPLLGEHLEGFPAEELVLYWMPGKREYGKRDVEIRSMLERAGKEALREMR